jgi:hypothetical protein
MKKISLVFLLLTVILSVHAQTSQPGNKKGLPAFDILQVDGSHLQLADLKKDVPAMLVYFDPDCDHCMLFIQEMLKKINSFSNIQIIMVTYVPLPNLKTFVSNLELNKYNTIRVGTEGNKFIVRYHYNVMQFPYVALHDKNGNLFATYESTVPEPAELAAMFKK